MVVAVTRSPLLKPGATVDAEELALRVMYDSIRRARGRCAVLEHAAKHTHLAGCRSLIAGTRYDPESCDCTGPATARGRIDLARRVFTEWSQKVSRSGRLQMQPLLDFVVEQLGPEIESCPKCQGTGGIRQDGMWLRCGQCGSSAIRLRKIREEAA
jgi:Zn finger protein HypA/HybF involved in hydrogenase expression